MESLSSSSEAPHCLPSLYSWGEVCVEHGGVGGVFLSSLVQAYSLQYHGFTVQCWPWWWGADRPAPDSEPHGSAGWVPWGGCSPETGPCWGPLRPSSPSGPTSGDGSRCAEGSELRCLSRCQRYRWATKTYRWRTDRLFQTNICNLLLHNQLFRLLYFLAFWHH